MGWSARSRLGGDRLDGDTPASDPTRFRLTALADGTAVRVWEVEASEALYAATDAAADEADAIRVEPWGEGYGWGEAAQASLV